MWVDFYNTTCGNFRNPRGVEMKLHTEWPSEVRWESICHAVKLLNICLVSWGVCSACERTWGVNPSPTGSVTDGTCKCVSSPNQDCKSRKISQKWYDKIHLRYLIDGCIVNMVGGVNVITEHKITWFFYQSMRRSPWQWEICMLWSKICTMLFDRNQHVSFQFLLSTSNYLFNFMPSQATQHYMENQFCFSCSVMSSSKTSYPSNWRL